MRREHDVGQRVERRSRLRRFRVRDVQNGKQICSLAQHLYHLPFANDRPTGRVDKRSIGLHRRKVLAGDHPLGLLEPGRVHRDHIRSRKDLLQGAALSTQARRLFLAGRIGEHTHIKGLEQSGNAAADHAQRDQTHLALVGTRHRLALRVAPIALDRQGVEPAALQREQDLRQRVLGSGYRVGCIGAGDQNAPIPARIGRKAPYRARSVEHSLQSGRGGEERIVHLGHPPPGKDDIGFGQDRRALLHRCSRLLGRIDVYKLADLVQF